MTYTSIPEGHGVHVMVLRQDVTYHAQIALGDRFDMQSEIVRLGRTSFTWEQRLVRADAGERTGEIATSAVVTMVCVDPLRQEHADTGRAAHPVALTNKPIIPTEPGEHVRPLHQSGTVNRRPAACPPARANIAPRSGSPAASRSASPASRSSAGPFRHGFAASRRVVEAAVPCRDGTTGELVHRAR